MTHSDDYIPYIISRLFAGFFGAVPTVLGPRIVTDLFFLHQRGRAFTALHMAFLAGRQSHPQCGAGADYCGTDFLGLYLGWGVLPCGVLVDRRSPWIHAYLLFPVS
jgi:hypothetical protein